MYRSQQTFSGLLALEEVQEFLDVYRRLAVRPAFWRFIFFADGYDFVFIGKFFRWYIHPSPGPRRVDQLTVVDDEDVDAVTLAQRIQRMFVRSILLLVRSTDFLAGFDHGILFHGIVVAVKTKADSQHQADNEKDGKAADIDAGLNL